MLGVLFFLFICVEGGQEEALESCLHRSLLIRKWEREGGGEREGEKRDSPLENAVAVAAAAVTQEEEEVDGDGGGRGGGRGAGGRGGGGRGGGGGGRRRNRSEKHPQVGYLESERERMIFFSVDLHGSFCWPEAGSFLIAYWGNSKPACKLC